jgi:hypothetical protein
MSKEKRYARDNVSNHQARYLVRSSRLHTYRCIFWRSSPGVVLNCSSHQSASRQTSSILPSRHLLKEAEPRSVGSWLHAAVRLLEAHDRVWHPHRCYRPWRGAGHDRPWSYTRTGEGRGRPCVERGWGGSPGPGRDPGDPPRAPSSCKQGDQAEVSWIEFSVRRQAPIPCSSPYAPHDRRRHMQARSCLPPEPIVNMPPPRCLWFRQNGAPTTESGACQGAKVDLFRPRAATSRQRRVRSWLIFGQRRPAQWCINSRASGGVSGEPFARSSGFDWN